MTNIEAALGLAQLEQIDWQLAQRRRVAAQYNEQLADLGHFLQLPHECGWAKHCYWMYSVVLKDDTGLDRDSLIDRLAGDGIETRPIFYPLHLLPPYLNDQSFPVAERIGLRGISLPTHASLSGDDIAYIRKCLRERLQQG